MEKLWIVQRFKDGTYGNWKAFKENREGVIFMKGKIYRYVYGDSINNQGIIQEKEVKKMSRPYFETKVVKVKKVEKGKEKCIHVGMAYAENKTGDTIECMNCGEYFVLEGKEQPKGNWVNGENLDKIKFPCFCSYGGSQYGMITKTKANEAFDNEFYTLHGIKKQYSSFSSIRSYYNFVDLIRVWDIHILKGKIIIFEGEE